MGLIVGLTGAGLRLAAEYHEHRRQQKLSRDDTPQDTIFESPSQPLCPLPDLPPSYAELDATPTGRRDAYATADKDIKDNSNTDSDYDDIDDEDKQDWPLEGALDSLPNDQSPPSYDDSNSQAEAIVTSNDFAQLAVSEGPRANKPTLADPDHPMFTGGLMGLVSGGTLTPMVEMRRQGRVDRRMAKHERRIERRLIKFERKTARRERRILGAVCGAAD